MNYSTTPCTRILAASALEHVFKFSYTLTVSLSGHGGLCKTQQEARRQLPPNTKLSHCFWYH